MNQITTIPLGMVNVYLIQGQIEDKISYVLVDTGNQPKAKKILSAIDSLKISLDQIKLIVLTHGHSDHFAGLKVLKAATGAKVITSKTDFEIMKEGLDSGIRGRVWWAKLMFAIFSLFPSKKPKHLAYESDIYIEDDYSLDAWGVDGQLVMTPGHSKGSISIYLNSGHAIIGDSLMDFSKRNKPSKPFIAYNLLEIKNSMNRLIEMGAQRFYLSHGKDYPIDMIKKSISTLE